MTRFYSTAAAKYEFARRPARSSAKAGVKTTPSQSSPASSTGNASFGSFEMEECVSSKDITTYMMRHREVCHELLNKHRPSVVCLMKLGKINETAQSSAIQIYDAGSQSIFDVGADDDSDFDLDEFKDSRMVPLSTPMPSDKSVWATPAQYSLGALTTGGKRWRKVSSLVEASPYSDDDFLYSPVVTSKRRRTTASSKKAKGGNRSDDRVAVHLHFDSRDTGDDGAEDIFHEAIDEIPHSPVASQDLDDSGIFHSPELIREVIDLIPTEQLETKPAMLRSNTALSDDDVSDVTPKTANHSFSFTPSQAEKFQNALGLSDSDHEKLEERKDGEGDDQVLTDASAPMKTETPAGEPSYALSQTAPAQSPRIEEMPAVGTGMPQHDSDDKAFEEPQQEEASTAVPAEEPQPVADEGGTHQLDDYELWLLKQQQPGEPELMEEPELLDEPDLVEEPAFVTNDTPELDRKPANEPAEEPVLEAVQTSTQETVPGPASTSIFTQGTEEPGQSLQSAVETTTTTDSHNESANESAQDALDEPTPEPSPSPEPVPTPEPTPELASASLSKETSGETAQSTESISAARDTTESDHKSHDGLIQGTPHESLPEPPKEQEEPGDIQQQQMDSTPVAEKPVADEHESSGDVKDGLKLEKERIPEGTVEATEHSSTPPKPQSSSFGAKDTETTALDSSVAEASKSEQPSSASTALLDPSPAKALIEFGGDPEGDHVKIIKDDKLRDNALEQGLQTVAAHDDSDGDADATSTPPKKDALADEAKESAGSKEVYPATDSSPHASKVTVENEAESVKETETDVQDLNTAFQSVQDFVNELGSQTEETTPKETQTAPSTTQLTGLESGVAAAALATAGATVEAAATGAPSAATAASAATVPPTPPVAAMVPTFSPPPPPPPVPTTSPAGSWPTSLSFNQATPTFSQGTSTFSFGQKTDAAAALPNAIAKPGTTASHHPTTATLLASPDGIADKSADVAKQDVAKQNAPTPPTPKSSVSAFSFTPLTTGAATPATTPVAAEADADAPNQPFSLSSTPPTKQHEHHSAAGEMSSASFPLVAASPMINKDGHESTQEEEGEADRVSEEIDTQQVEHYFDQSAEMTAHSTDDYDVWIATKQTADEPDHAATQDSSDAELATGNDQQIEPTELLNEGKGQLDDSFDVWLSVGKQHDQSTKSSLDGANESTPSTDEHLPETLLSPHNLGSPQQQPRKDESSSLSASATAATPNKDVQDSKTVPFGVSDSPVTAEKQLPQAKMTEEVTQATPVQPQTPSNDDANLTRIESQPYQDPPVQDQGLIDDDALKKLEGQDGSGMADTVSGRDNASAQATPRATSPSTRSIAFGSPSIETDQSVEAKTTSNRGNQQNSGDDDHRRIQSPLRASPAASRSKDEGVGQQVLGILGDKRVPPTNPDAQNPPRTPQRKEVSNDDARSEDNYDVWLGKPGDIESYDFVDRQPDATFAPVPAAVPAQAEVPQAGASLDETFDSLDVWIDVENNIPGGATNTASQTERQQPAQDNARTVEQHGSCAAADAIPVAHAPATTDVPSNEAVNAKSESNTVADAIVDEKNTLATKKEYGQAQDAVPDIEAAVAASDKSTTPQPPPPPPSTLSDDTMVRNQVKQPSNNSDETAAPDASTDSNAKKANTDRGAEIVGAVVDATVGAARQEEEMKQAQSETGSTQLTTTETNAEDLAQTKVHTQTQIQMQKQTSTNDDAELGISSTDLVRNELESSTVIVEVGEDAVYDKQSTNDTAKQSNPTTIDAAAAANTPNKSDEHPQTASQQTQQGDGTIEVELKPDTTESGLQQRQEEDPRSASLKPSPHDVSSLAEEGRSPSMTARNERQKSTSGLSPPPIDSAKVAGTGKTDGTKESTAGAGDAEPEKQPEAGGISTPARDTKRQVPESAAKMADKLEGLSTLWQSVSKDESCRTPIAHESPVSSLSPSPVGSTALVEFDLDAATPIAPSPTEAKSLQGTERSQTSKASTMGSSRKIYPDLAPRFLTEERAKMRRIRGGPATPHSVQSTKRPPSPKRTQAQHKSRLPKFETDKRATRIPYPTGATSPSLIPSSRTNSPLRRAASPATVQSAPKIPADQTVTSETHPTSATVSSRIPSTRPMRLPHSARMSSPAQRTVSPLTVQSAPRFLTDERAAKKKYPSGAATPSRIPSARSSHHPHSSRPNSPMSRTASPLTVQSAPRFLTDERAAKKKYPSGAATPSRIPSARSSHHPHPSHPNSPMGRTASPLTVQSAPKFLTDQRAATKTYPKGATTPSKIPSSRTTRSPVTQSGLRRPETRQLRVQTSLTALAPRQIESTGKIIKNVTPRQSDKKGQQTSCPNTFIDKLHPSVGPCDRCWSLASPSDQAKFKKKGTSLCIQRTRGGCKGCKIFPSPSEADKEPIHVRLCTKCFNDTHLKVHDRMQVYRGNHHKLMPTS